MIITLIAWVYISFFCWVWGRLVLRFIQKISGEELPPYHFSIVCLAGLSAITVTSGIVSLFIPLGSWWVQLIFLTPGILLLLKKESPGFLKTVSSQFSGLHLVSFLLLLACLLMVLVMSTWKIVHPDTLGYHAQTIQWIEKYRAVPGLVHLHVRFGYQGLWFVSEALFGLRFTGVDGTTFLNSTVLAWFFIFIISRINFYFYENGNHLPGLLWITMLALCTWSYTQVRLTATSASPDFIAAIYVWAVVCLLLDKKEKNNYQSAGHWLFVALPGLVAITIKLSAAPVVLTVAAAIVVFIKQKRFKLIFAVLIISAITLFPFFARNIITTGYAVFPNTVVDIVNVDWKYSKQLTEHEKNYITAYARKNGVSHGPEAEQVMRLKSAEWLPGWWQQQSSADKFIIILLIASVMAALLQLKKIIRAGFKTILVYLITLPGVVFWFVAAPDPRFGFGSITGLIAATAYLATEGKKISLNKKLSSAVLLAFSLIITAYTGYRFTRFFEKNQWLAPRGIEKTAYTTFDCSELKINRPVAGKEFSNIPVPCSDLDCDNFFPRGEKIAEGFRAK